MYTYRDWLIEFENPPIPYRGCDWVATHPDYDGYGDNRIVRAGTLEEIRAEIDAWHNEHDPFGGYDGGPTVFGAAIVLMAVIIVAIVMGSK